MSNKRFCPSTVELMAPGAPLALRIRREVPDIAIEPKVAQALFRGICCCAAGGETCSASLGGLMFQPPLRLRPQRAYRHMRVIPRECTVATDR
jgi:hypothetical protein